MIVYMLLNTITEKCYIGQTLRTLEERWKDHCKTSRQSAGRTSCPLKQALFDWPYAVWEQIELETCSTLEELDAVEVRWIGNCDVRNTEVGYNHMPGGQNNPVSRRQFSEWGKKGAKRKENMTPEELEKYRQWGALSKRKPITPEQREKLREGGKKGAATYVANLKKKVQK